MGLGKKKILSQGASDDGGYFTPKLYSGGSAGQVVSGVGFQPDLIIGKRRDSAEHWWVNDVARSGKSLFANLSDAQISFQYTTPNSDGFVVNATGGVHNTGNLVAYCFKGGGAASSNTSGSITSQVSANQAAGFSIVEFTTSANGTIGHGLSAAPQLIITKLYTRIGSWSTYSEPTGNTKYLQLDSGNAAATGTGRWNSTTPSASTFVLGSDFGSGHACICYCFTSIPGYQKIGSYTGSGVSGKSVTTGFQPRFLMIKGINFGNGYWFILDNQRTSGTNGKLALWANEALGESSSYDVRFDATGFTLLNTDTHLNQSYDYLYLAIA